MMQGFLSTTFSTIRAVAPKMLHGFGMSHIQHGSFNFMTNDVRGITNYTAGNAIPNLNMSKISRRDQYPTTMNPQMMAGDMRHMPLSALALTGTMLGSSWAVLDDDITLNPEQTPRKTWMDDWKDSFVYPPLEELEQNEKDINKSQSFIVLGDENAIQPKSGEAPQKTSAEILDAIEQNLPNNKKIIEEDIQKISDLAKELEKKSKDKQRLIEQAQIQINMRNEEGLELQYKEDMLAQISEEILRIGAEIDAIKFTTKDLEATLQGHIITHEKLEQDYYCAKEIEELESQRRGGILGRIESYKNDGYLGEIKFWGATFAIGAALFYGGAPLLGVAAAGTALAIDVTIQTRNQKIKNRFVEIKSKIAEGRKVLEGLNAYTGEIKNGLLSLKDVLEQQKRHNDFFGEEIARIENNPNIPIRDKEAYDKQLATTKQDIERCGGEILDNIKDINSQLKIVEKIEERADKIKENFDKWEKRIDQNIASINATKSASIKTLAISGSIGGVALGFLYNSTFIGIGGAIGSAILTQAAVISYNYIKSKTQRYVSNNVALGLLTNNSNQKKDTTPEVQTIAK